MTDKTYDIAVQEATFALARPGSLPKWLEIPALGRDMTPIAEIAVAAAYPIIAASVALSAEAPVDAPEPPAPIGTAAAQRRVEALCRKACEQCSACETCVLVEVQA
jgi:hypothetical protein